MISSNKTNLSISLLLLLATSALAARSCQQDYQCGIPYSYCYNGEQDCYFTLDGVAVSGGKVYYGENCRAPDNAEFVKGQKSNNTLKEVDIASGQITNIFSQEKLRSGGIGGIFGNNGDNLYVNRFRRYTGLDTFNIVTYEDQVVLLKFYNSLFVTTEDSYACVLNRRAAADDYRVYYDINRYPGAISSSSHTSAQTIYSVLSGYCGPIYVSGHTIFFVFQYYIGEQEVSSLYRGTTLCSSCEIPAPLFTMNGTITGIVQDPSDSNTVYFGTASAGIYSYAQTTGGIQLLNEDDSNGVIVFYAGSIYYNNGASIRSINTATLQVRTVNYQKIGECKCAPGFTGDDCQTCTGQVQWTNGYPTCVATNTYGIPQSCTDDYQCGNPPYTYCNYGSCDCQTGFTGPQCNQCEGTITWTDGIPSCA